MSTDVKNLIDVVKPVEDPTLIRVMTLREKMVNQMPQMALADLKRLADKNGEDLKVIGRTAHAWMILIRRPNNTLVKASHEDWVQFLLRNNRKAYADAIEQAHDEIDGYHQMFAV